ncbi:hypothetical protein SAMN05880556_102111 [Azospirillum sp. RU38E]|nr:hypothetical protein SAMN05880556_102111 [Azospirillum sp. RU38E]SNS30068.1 hypothetical protein SAMN05880591_102111 [Azospirillum sp. RU37A]
MTRKHLPPPTKFGSTGTVQNKSVSVQPPFGTCARPPTKFGPDGHIQPRVHHVASMQTQHVGVGTNPPRGQHVAPTIMHATNLPVQLKENQRLPQGSLAREPTKLKAEPARSILGKPTFAAAAKVLQRALVLDTQRGPSCWLAVGTALVGARNHDRSNLDALISLYPLDSSGRGRAEIMDMIINALDSAIARLNAHRFRGNVRVTRDQVREFVRRGFRSVGQSVDGTEFFRRYFVSNDYTVMQAVEVLTVARDHAADFRNEIQQHGEDTTSIYGYAGVEFGADNDIGTLRTLLDVSMHHASASMSVTGRYLPTGAQLLAGGPVNLKASPLHRGGAHLVVLVDVNTATDTITYRDPNYGNVDLQISFAQFEAMRNANNGAIRLNSVSNDSPIVRAATGGLTIPTI